MLIRHHTQPWELLTELNNLLERPSQRDETSVETSRWLPAVDIKEEPDQFVLYVDVPGVDSAHIDIQMENNVLTIKGTREETKKEDKDSFHRIERIKGVFYRRFTLPNTADADQISAKTKQGVLEIVIGKKKLARARKIEIKAEK